MQFHEHECSSMGMQVLMFCLFVIKLKFKGCLRFYNVPEGYPRFPKVPKCSKALHELACSYISLNAVKRDCMKIHELACNYISLHAVAQACMQLLKLACSNISLHAVT